MKMLSIPAIDEVQAALGQLSQMMKSGDIMSLDEAAQLKDALNLVSLCATFCLTDEYGEAYGVKVQLSPATNPEGAHATFQELEDDSGKGLTLTLHAVPAGIAEFADELQAALLLHLALAALSFQEGHAPVGPRTEERFNRALAWISAGAEGATLN